VSKIVSKNVVVTKGNFPAICDSDFEILGNGAFFVVVTGQNGSGKTTLLKAIAGINPILRGQIIINETDVDKNPIDIKKIALYIGHSFSFLDHIKVKELFELNSKLDIISRSSDFENEAYKIMSVDEALEFCQLSNRSNVYVQELSAGQQRRLQLSCAFMRSVDLLLIDEPHASLDDASKDNFDQEFAQQFMSGRSIIVATHDPSRIEHLATDHLHINNGVVHYGNSR
jgi:ABC-type multidrug transport system ATPase subunit